ncbi:hypothetical protein BT69DRAFT_1280605 [Atractiella rhizophila]|nr:hypothetical protein BT69DRAFT_1280605 [Atractiella rhizophila]
MVQPQETPASRTRSKSRESHVTLVASVSKTVSRIPSGLGKRLPTSSKASDGIDVPASRIPSSSSRLPTLQKKASASSIISSGISQNFLASTSKANPIPPSLVPAPVPAASLKRNSFQAGLPLEAPTPLKKTLPHSSSSPSLSLSHSLDRTLSASQNGVGASSSPDHSAALVSLQKEVVGLTSDRNVLEGQLKEKDMRIAQLERDRKEWVDKFQTKEEEWKESITDSRQEIERTEQELKALRVRFAEVEERLREREEEKRERDHELDKAVLQVQEKEAKLVPLEAEIERMAEEAARREEEIDRAVEERNALERKVEDLTGRLKGEERKEEDELLLREMRGVPTTELESVNDDNKKLRLENQTMKEKSRQIPILEEQIRTLNVKVSNLESIRERSYSLESDLKTLTAEKASWTSYLSSSDLFPKSDDQKEMTPKGVCKLLLATKLEVKTLQDKLELQVSEGQARLEFIEKLEKAETELEGRLREEEEARMRAEAKLGQWESVREMDRRLIESLKSQLESYNTEEAMFQKGNYDEQKVARIGELEGLVAEYSGRIEELENELQSYRDGAATSRFNDAATTRNFTGFTSGEPTRMEDLKQGMSVLLEEAERIKNENAELRNERILAQREIESLSLELSQASQSLGRGEYDASKYKVLSLIDNPSAKDQGVKKEVLNSLKEENKILVERVNRLEKKVKKLKEKGVEEDGDTTRGFAGSTGTVPMETLKNVEDELKQSQDDLAYQKKMNSRLMDQYKVKSHELKQSIYTLLGYKLVVLENGQVNLTSSFTSRDNILSFRRSSSSSSGWELTSCANPQFLEQDFVQDAMDLWFSKDRGSIPGFLASLTLELFERSSTPRNVMAVADDG